MRRFLASVPFVLAVACAGAGGTGASARSGPFVPFSVDERVVIPDMTVILGVAATNQYVFIATPQALGIYNRRFGGWLPPLSRVDGWPRGPVTVFAPDPSDDAVWFGAEGSVFMFRVATHDLARARLVGDITSLFFNRDDPASGAYVTAGGAYWRVSPTGFTQRLGTNQIPPVARRILPPTLAQVYRQYPSVRDFERLLTRDEALRTWQVTSGATSPTESQVWLGTAGGGLFQVDPLFARSEARPFGLAGRGAGAVALAADGVWIGPAAFGGVARNELTYASHSLQNWRWVGGGVPSPFAGVRVLALSAYESSVWAATDRGLIQVDAQTGLAPRRWDDASGLPGTIAHAVVGTHDGAWVGTSRGIAFVRNVDGPAGARATDVQRTLLMGTAVRALLRRGDTLWIGSEAGVLVLAPRDTVPRRLRAAQRDPRLSSPVTALATYDSVVAIANATGEVVQIGTRTGDALATQTVLNAARAGAIYGLAMDARTLWIAGARGVLVVERASGAQRFLPAESAIPGEAFGVVLTPEYAWIAARDGAVRLRRTSDGMVR